MYFFQCGDEVGRGAQGVWVEVETDGAADEDGFLGDGIEALADELAGERGDVNAVDGNGAFRQLEHAEETGY